MFVIVVVVIVVVVVVGMKIASSRDLGVCACCKHSELVNIGEKLLSVLIELLIASYIQHACGLLTAPIS